ncbi:MAG TPA: hypothetical protein VLD65_12380 [Anaerolineales bacterium]|nr:hypothetical protein [Anaerolineales bacterium]
MLKKWLLPLACLGLVIISMLPPYTDVPYDPRNTQEVIGSILRISIQPYQGWGWLFHLATLLLVLFILWQPAKAGRALAGYIGVNYLIIAAFQTHAITEEFGFALQTGALIGILAVGIMWLVVAIQNSLQLSLHHISKWKYLLLPFAFLTFWSPVKVEGLSVFANFDPRLLLTSADYGLAYCFVTPIFLLLLILFSTNHTSFTYRITAFNALVYGLFNLTHWFNPNTLWMGVMHLPLLILAIVAFLLPYAERRHMQKPAFARS